MKVSFHVHIVRFDLGRSSPPLLTFFVSFSADEAGVQQKKEQLQSLERGWRKEEGPKRKGARHKRSRWRGMAKL